MKNNCVVYVRVILYNSSENKLGKIFNARF